MEMINRLNEDALDSQKFVDDIKAQEHRIHLMHQRTRDEQSGGYETRTQRRARERAEAKADRRNKTITAQVQP